jgi:MFS family permease
MTDISDNTLHRVSKRVIPLLFLLYLFSYVDRVNIGYAGLQMNTELGFNPAVFGLGAGLLFLGYVLFGIPSNFLMKKIGGRVWLSMLAIAWGTVAIGNASISSKEMFYGMRFLLGLAESGFVPGMLLYLTQWYPQSERGKVVSTLYMATAVSVIVAGPLCGAIMQMDGLLGVSGWKWILILEGIPPILLGVFALKYLPERPETTEWLNKTQREWLVSKLAEGEVTQANKGYATFRSALRAPIVWVFGLIYFLLGIGFFSVMIWLPIVIKQLSGLSTVQVSFVSAIPFVFASICMPLYGRHSDRTNERQWHLVFALLVGSAGLAASAASSNPIVGFAAICIAAIGLWSATGIFWPMSTSFLSGSGATGGLALINSIGILGGFVGPYFVGLIRNMTPNFSIALISVAAIQLLAAIVTSQIHRSAVLRTAKTELPSGD